MDKLKETVKPDRPTCEQCRKEIPPSASESTEAADYIYHFCGPDCHMKWQKKQVEGQKPE